MKKYMSASAKSVLYFSYYLLLVGLQFVFVPNFFLNTIQQPDTSEPWIRVTGILALLLFFYYHQCAKKEITGFFKLTVVTRLFFFIAITALVVFKLAPPIFIGLGAVDLAAAAWTWRCLKSEGKM
jgi:hypothetical protein